jgi:hypothetical protein
MYVHVCMYLCEDSREIPGLGRDARDAVCHPPPSTSQPHPNARAHRAKLSAATAAGAVVPPYWLMTEAHVTESLQVAIEQLYVSKHMTMSAQPS